MRVPEKMQSECVEAARKEEKETKKGGSRENPSCRLWKKQENQTVTSTAEDVLAAAATVPEEV